MSKERTRWHQIMFVAGATAATAVLTAILMTTDAASAREKSRLSLLDELAALQPALTCVDATDKRNHPALERCLSLSKLTVADLEGLKAASPTPPQAILITWLMIDPGPGVDINEGVWSSAMDYAACMEKAAYNFGTGADGSEQGYYAVRRQAEASCASLTLTPSSSEEIGSWTEEQAARWLLGKSLANLTFSHVAHANGWFPNELVPCYRYLDGRPPSPGCAGKPEGRPPPPAPPR